MKKLNDEDGFLDAGKEYANVYNLQFICIFKFFLLMLNLKLSFTLAVVSTKDNYYCTGH